MEIKVLNIPNFYSSFYLLGLSQVGKVRFENDSRFVKYNNTPFLIFKMDNKIGKKGRAGFHLRGQESRQNGLLY